MALMFRPVPVEQEPKRQNRFVLEFPTELGIESYLVQTAGRPNMSINSVEIPYMNTSFYVAGRYTFDTITISFIDPIGPSTMQRVMEWVRLHADPATGRMGYAIGYKKNLIIKMLDPTGVEVEKWTLIGCQCTNVSGGSLDYSSDSLATVEITVQPDIVILNA